MQYIKSNDYKRLIHRLYFIALDLNEIAALNRNEIYELTN